MTLTRPRHPSDLAASGKGPLPGLDYGTGSDTGDEAAYRLISPRYYQDPTTNGTTLQIYDCNGLSTQQWVLAGAPTSSIFGPGTTGECVDDNHNTGVNGNTVQLWGCDGAQGQQWAMNADGTIRTYGKCLDIDGNGSANLTQVELWTCDGAGGQQWVPQTNGSLVNPQSGRCLDDPAGVTTPGTTLQIYDCNGLSSQQWVAAL